MPAHNRRIAPPRPIHSPAFLRGAAPRQIPGWVRLAGGSPRLVITVGSGARRGAVGRVVRSRGSPRATMLRAAASSAQVAKRAHLSFAIAFWITTSMACGRFGFTTRMFGAGSVMCLTTTPMGVSAL